MIHLDIMCEHGLHPATSNQSRTGARLNLTNTLLYGGAAWNRMKVNLPLRFSVMLWLLHMSMQGTKKAWLGNINLCGPCQLAAILHLPDDGRLPHHSSALPRLLSTVLVKEIDWSHWQHAALSLGISFTLYHGCVSTLLPSPPPSLPPP
jgi:hypothetical protein